MLGAPSGLLGAGGLACNDRGLAVLQRRLHLLADLQVSLSGLKIERRNAVEVIRFKILHNVDEN